MSFKRKMAGRQRRNLRAVVKLQGDYNTSQFLLAACVARLGGKVALSADELNRTRDADLKWATSADGAVVTLTRHAYTVPRIVGPDGREMGEVHEADPELEQANLDAIARAANRGEKVLS